MGRHTSSQETVGETVERGSASTWRGLSGTGLSRASPTPVRRREDTLHPPRAWSAAGYKRQRGGSMSDSDLMFRSAVELAAMVRGGEVSARELVEISLERIEELNPALNAFVDVDAERALHDGGADRSGRRATVRGGAGRGEEQPPRRRPAPDLRLCADGAEHVRLRPQRHAAPARGRFRDRRHDDAARVRHPARLRGAHLRPHAQPLGSRPHPRRLLGRRGGGGRLGDGSRRPRQRRRRLDPDPRRLLRAGRPEARARAGSPSRPNSATPRSASTGC